MIWPSVRGHLKKYSVNSGPTLFPASAKLRKFSDKERMRECNTEDTKMGLGLWKEAGGRRGAAKEKKKKGGT